MHGENLKRPWETKSRFSLSDCPEMKGMQIKVILLLIIAIWVKASESSAQVACTNHSEPADIISSAYPEIKSYH